MYGKCKCFVMQMFMSCVYPVSVLKAAFCMTYISNSVGLPLHNIPSSGVLMKSTREELLRPDALSGVNHSLHFVDAGRACKRRPYGWKRHTSEPFFMAAL